MKDPAQRRAFPDIRRPWTVIDISYRFPNMSVYLHNTYREPGMDSSGNEALTKLASRIAQALEEFVRDHNSESFDEETSDGDMSGLGPRQQQAYELLRHAPEPGIKTADLADAMKYDAPNAYLTLKSLANRGLAEMVPGSSPQRWRVARKRGSSARYLVAAQLIRPGEWTTYGDVSIAVRGDDRAARAIGSAAKNLPDFPNPERIIGAGGVIPQAWNDGEGGGPEVCRNRLENQGVTFDSSGRAEGRYRLGWEHLRQRLIDAGVDVPPMPSDE